MSAQTFAQRCFSAAVGERPGRAGLFLGLAPMDGFTDHVFRELMTSAVTSGAAASQAQSDGGGHPISLCVTEFFRVTDAVIGESEIIDRYPEVLKGGVTASGVPVIAQVMGNEPQLVAQTAARLASMGAPGVDLNFGCPVKAVNRREAGAALLKDPQRVESICRAVRAAVPGDTAFGVKVRLGWDDDAGLCELARRIEGAGADWLTVHGRTRRDGYRGQADWQAIGRARQAVAIPVVANGDLTRMAQLDACAKQSGCTAFMIGRGVLGRPDIFHQLRGLRAPGDSAELLATTLEAYALALLQDGMRPRGVVNRVRHWLRLIPIATEESRELLSRLGPGTGAEALLDQLASLRLVGPMDVAS